MRSDRSGKWGSGFYRKTRNRTGKGPQLRLELGDFDGRKCANEEPLLLKFLDKFGDNLVGRGFKWHELDIFETLLVLSDPTRFGGREFRGGPMEGTLDLLQLCQTLPLLQEASLTGGGVWKEKSWKEMSRVKHVPIAHNGLGRVTLDRQGIELG